MDKNDKFFSGLRIDEIWPVLTDVAPRGIGIDWSSDSEVGQCQLMWLNDGKLHADITCLRYRYNTPVDSDTGKRFIETILSLLASEIVLDG